MKSNRWKMNVCNVNMYIVKYVGSDKVRECDICISAMCGRDI